MSISFCDPCCASRGEKCSLEGFQAREYDALCFNLEVQSDDPKTPLELDALLERFPEQLRPVMHRMLREWTQDNEMTLGDGSVVTWSNLVSGFSQLLTGGDLTWREIFHVCNVAETSSADCAQLSEFCFWCAHPDRSPSAHGASDISAADLDSEDTHFPKATNLQQLLASINGCTCAELNDLIPMLPRAIKTCLVSLLLDIPAPLSFKVPESQLLDAGLAFLLRGMSCAVWNLDAWKPLYRDWCDGRSFRSLVKTSSTHPGPIVIVIKTDEGAIIGAIFDRMPKTDPSFIRDDTCTLFCLLPRLRVLRAIGNSKEHLYLNTQNVRCQRGMGFGGKVGWHRLWLDADFENCYMLRTDMAFENGLIVPYDGDKNTFKVSRIEVWGCPQRRMPARSKTDSFDRNSSRTNSFGTDSSYLGSGSSTPQRQISNDDRFRNKLNRRASA